MRVAFLLPGQGSQYAGMAQDIYHANAHVRELFECASDILDMDISKICFNSSESELIRTSVVQPVMYVAVTAFAAYYTAKYNIAPTFYAGHSMGEYAALHLAGALSFEDGLRIVSMRGKYMENACLETTGGMLAVRCDANKLRLLLDKERRLDIWISAYNDMTQCVLSGTYEGLECMTPILKENNIPYKTLHAAGAFHSHCMNSAKDAFMPKVEDFELREFHTQVISCTTGVPYGYWGGQNFLTAQCSLVIEPVLWWQVMSYLQSRQVGLYLEVGPGRVLGNLAKKSLKDAVALSLDLEEDRSQLERLLQNVRYTQTEDVTYETFLTRCIKEALSCPIRESGSASFQDGADCFYKLENLWQEKKNKLCFNQAECDASLLLLKQILHAKGYSQDEITHRVNLLTRSRKW